MLYSIIPPVLIIMSLVGIIIILVRKYSRSKQLIDEEVRKDQRAEIAGTKNNFFRRLAWEKVKFFFLAILDGIAKFFRFLFFRLGSVFSQWSAKLKVKRQNRVEEKKKTSENKIGNNYENVLEKLREYRIAGRQNRIEVGKGGTDSGETVIEEIAEEETVQISSEGQEKKIRITAVQEREIRPMLSDKVANPEPRAEIRDRLEELLIERIAANPKDIEAYERLGEYYMEIKNYEFAKECFKQVIKLDPLNRNVKYKMRRLEHLLSR